MIITGQRWTTSQRELLGLVVELDRSGAWALDGPQTCSHWVASALDIEICTARVWIRIGLALERYALLAAKFAEGRLAYSKVRTFTRVVTPEFEADLCDLGERTPAGRLSTAIAAWLGRHEEPEETEERQQQARSLTYRVESDGMVVGYFRLPPLAAAGVAAVDALVTLIAGGAGGGHGVHIESKQFDLIVLSLQLAMLRTEPSLVRLQRQVRAIAPIPEDHARIPAVHAELPLIQDLQSDQWWIDATFPMVEDVRRRLRALVALIERAAASRCTPTSPTSWTTAVSARARSTT